LPVCPFVREQVRELCTNYGEIHGIWWDANYLLNAGPDPLGVIPEQSWQILKDKGALLICLLSFTTSPQLPELLPVFHWRHPGMLPELLIEMTQVVETAVERNVGNAQLCIH
jgi:hypothetical protein